MGRHNIASVVIHYGLEGPGIEFLWRRNFPYPFRPYLEPTQPPVQAGTWR